MSSYEIAFYTREDLTFGRDGDGNYTVTVNEGATPETIEIVDNDAGDDGDTFSGSTSAGATGQDAYGDINGTSIEGDPIQPLAALPGHDNPDDQIMAIGVGEPVHTVGYGFTYEPVPGETVTFDYDRYDTSPSYSADSLYVEGESESSSAASSAEGVPSSGEEPSDASAPSGESSTSSSASSPSTSSDPSSKSGTSGASGGAFPLETSSGASGSSSPTEPSGSTQPSATSGASGGSGTSGASGGSGPSESSGSSAPSGGSGPSGGGSGPSEPLCFTQGTAIRTARGEILVEDLLVDDMVWTEGHGMQPIRWICQREVPAKGDFAPIRIRVGTLGADRDILVSPAHRMLVQGAEIEVLFGMPKALVAAKDLVNDSSITRETTLDTVTYFHILFDRHEVLQAHGTLSESFFPHVAAVGDVDAEQRKELFTLFPELALNSHGYSVVYPSLMAHEVKLLGRQVF